MPKYTYVANGTDTDTTISSATIKSYTDENAKKTHAYIKTGNIPSGTETKAKVVTISFHDNKTMKNRNNDLYAYNFKCPDNPPDQKLDGSNFSVKANGTDSPLGSAGLFNQSSYNKTNIPVIIERIDTDFDSCSKISDKFNLKDRLKALVIKNHATDNDPAVDGIAYVGYGKDVAYKKIRSQKFDKITGCVFYPSYEILEDIASKIYNDKFNALKNTMILSIVTTLDDEDSFWSNKNHEEIKLNKLKYRNHRTVLTINNDINNMTVSDGVNPNQHNIYGTFIYVNGNFIFTRVIFSVRVLYTFTSEKKELRTDTTTVYVAGWVDMESLKDHAKCEIFLDEAQFTQTDDSLRIASNEISNNALDTLDLNSAEVKNKLSTYMNINSIIGMPFTFLSNADIRYMSDDNDEYEHSDMYGAQYMENIIYDMPIAVLRPGYQAKGGKNTNILGSLANLQLAISNNDWKSYIDSFIRKIICGDIYRFYQFDSAYQEYISYVNTLCHLFAMFCGIDKLDCGYEPGMYEHPNDGIVYNKTYGTYNDTIYALDGLNDSFVTQFGQTPAIYCFYQPDSSLNHSFTTELSQPSIEGTAQGLSDKARQYHFFGKALGITSGAGEAITNLFADASDGLDQLMGALGLGNLAGIGNVANGHNISFPEIWSDSKTSVSHSFNIKLVSPYGDPESIFIHILRPLARILALALPQQTSANSYTSPFIVQAFSKGQFNCQMGIVTSLNITRGGNGGESHTVNHMPTELDLTVEIQDMYEKVMATDLYDGSKLMTIGKLFNAPRTLSLLTHNIGLLDFVASYAGYNLNQPDNDKQINLAKMLYKNTMTDGVNVGEFGDGDLKMASIERWMIDNYINMYHRATSFLSS